MRAVAIGGGHGTAVTLRALREVTSEITAVVSVADDGGSTGRLREMLDVAAVGDLRKCLGALADPDNPLARVLEHRFRAGDLEGHALGNLVLAGLIDASGELEQSIDDAAALLGVTGRVLPAASSGVTLVARSPEGRTEGQTEVAATRSIGRVTTEPRDVVAPHSVLDAIREADLVVIGPGSLFTSVLAACVVPGIPEALEVTRAQRVFVANLREQPPETAGMTLADHLSALRDHGICFDVAIAASDGALERGDTGSSVVVETPLTGRNLRVHDPDRLARALASLVA